MDDRHARLSAYLDARRNREDAWIVRYDESVIAGKSDDACFPYLAGHYAGLLDDVLSLVGENLVRLAIEAANGRAK
jgi:hypothetical protein